MPIHQTSASAARSDAKQDRLPTELPALLTPAEAISYLRLNVDQRDPAERLRNLVRRQGLPCIRRGRLLLFRRSAIDAWADGRK